MGKKRLRVEVLLAATALPSPPPAPAALLSSLLPDPTGADLQPEDDPVVTRLLRVLPEADVYRQDEVQLAFHPTLTRVWCPAGWRGQRTVQAPGDNAKRWGFCLVDGRDGWFDWAIAERRAADPFCVQLRRAVARPRARGRAAVILDNLGGSTPRAARPGCALLDACRDDLLLLHTSPDDPDSSRIAWRWEWRWRTLRQAVTHNPAAPPSPTSSPLLIDADTWAGGSRPMIACFSWAARAPMTRTPSTPPPWRSRMPHELLGST